MSLVGGMRGLIEKQRVVFLFFQTCVLVLYHGLYTRECLETIANDVVTESINLES